jgi:hypothetical protein
MTEPIRGSYPTEGDPDEIEASWRVSFRASVGWRDSPDPDSDPAAEEEEAEAS